MWRKCGQSGTQRLVRTVCAVKREGEKHGWSVAELRGIELPEKFDCLVMLAEIAQGARELKRDLVLVLGIQASGESLPIWLDG